VRLGLRGCDLGGGLSLGHALHQLAQLQLQLGEQAGALGGRPEPLVLQLSDRQLESLDLRVQIARVLVGCDRHRLERGDVVGELSGIEGHARHNSCFVPFQSASRT
jgi:hypothetical protein